MATILWWSALLWLALVFVLYPALLQLLALLQPARRSPAPPPRWPSVSVIVVVRNAGSIIDAKIANCLALDYPPDLLEFLFVSDGSTDDTVTRLQAAARRDQRIRVLEVTDHRGKIHGMNLAAAAARGEVLLFTDGDALLAADSPRLLVTHLQDPTVGGVCGRRTILAADQGTLAAPQGRYIAFDSRIKQLESRLGSITANDGKLYLVRRRLYQPVPDGVTDDLFVLLTVVGGGSRFVFDDRARAWIRRPSRNPAHEWQRRRRIVSSSWRGIWLGRKALDLWRRPLFTLGLVVNKVLRRLLALPLAMLLGASLALAPRHPLYALATAGQLAFYLLAALPPLGLSSGRLGRLAEIAWYFTLGVGASLVGVVDCFLGRTARSWEPVKGD